MIYRTPSRLAFVAWLFVALLTAANIANLLKPGQRKGERADNPGHQGSRDKRKPAPAEQQKPVAVRVVLKSHPHCQGSQYDAQHPEKLEWAGLGLIVELFFDALILSPVLP
jgi:hypothetical protein